MNLGPLNPYGNISPGTATLKRNISRQQGTYDDVEGDSSRANTKPSAPQDPLLRRISSSESGNSGDIEMMQLNGNGEHGVDRMGAIKEEKSGSSSLSPAHKNIINRIEDRHTRQKDRYLGKSYRIYQ